MDGIQLEKLYVLIEAQTSEFNSQMTKVNSRIDSMSKGVTSAAQNANKKFSTVGKAIIAAFSVRALLGFFNKFLEITKQTEIFKKSLAEALEPLVISLTPVLNNILTTIATVTARIVGMYYAIRYGANAMAEYSKNTKKAATNQASLTKQLAGFDELNTLSDGTSTPVADVTSIIDTNQAIQEGVDLWEKYGNTVTNVLKGIGLLLAAIGINSLISIIGKGIVPILKVLGILVDAFFTEITMGLSPLMMSLQKAAYNLGQFVFGIFGSMNISVGGFIAIGLGVIAVIGLLIAAFVDLWNSSERFRTVITTIIDIIKGVALIVIGTLAVWIGILMEIVFEIADALYELYQNSLKPVVEVFFYLAGAIATLMAGAFGTALLVTINLVGAALSFVLGVVLGVVEAFNSLFKAIAEGNPWAIAFGGILLGIVAPAIIAATTALWGMLSALAATTIALIKQIVQWGLQAAATIASSVATAAMTIATWLLNTAFWANPITWIIAGIIALVAIFVWAYQKFEVFRNGVNGVWEGIKKGFKGLVNFIIDGINTMITALNGFKINIPKWVPVIGGKDFSLNIPLVPRLAEGGLLDAGSLFVAGEAGAELIGSYNNQTTVMPLQNTDFTIAMKSAVVAGVIEGIAASSNGNSTTTLVVDGMTLAKAVESNLNKLSTVQGGLKIAL